jgi:AraC-like DNA-binding protein
MSADDPSKPILIAAYGRAIATALEQRGISAPEVFDRAGVPLSTTSDPMRRMSNTDVTALFRESVEVTNDPYFGLFVADNLHIGTLHALGLALLVSSSLRDFCIRLCNYYHLVSQNVEITLVENAEEAILNVEVLNPDICWETVDAFAAMMVRLMRAVGDPQLVPRRVELIRPQPAQGDGPYREYFHCDVLFDQADIRICLSPSVMDVPLPGASRELAEIHDRTAMEYLEKLGRRDISSRMRAAVVDILSTGMVSKQKIADRLNMSPRNLEVKLARENTNFQQVLDTTRQSLAAGYIEQSSISITETAYLLGFSDAANFTRAFKRWTGKSPLEFRKSLGLQH